LPAARRGQRALLAITGGFVSDVVFGSAATDLRAGFGGHGGRALQRGDRVRSAGLREPLRLPARVFTSLAHPAVVSPEPLSLLAGPALEQMSSADRERLLHGSFTVSRASDRMGLRLEESLPSAAHLPPVLSAPVAFGTLQLPPDGKGIVLGADRQTTGGYPVAGVVASIDHGRLAQLRPGETLRFRLQDVDKAREAWRARERQLAQLRIAASAWWREDT
jgi:antagonist of KipI